MLTRRKVLAGAVAVAVSAANPAAPSTIVADDVIGFSCSGS